MFMGTEEIFHNLFSFSLRFFCFTKFYDTSFNFWFRFPNAVNIALQVDYIYASIYVCNNPYEIFGIKCFQWKVFNPTSRKKCEPLFVIYLKF